MAKAFARLAARSPEILEIGSQDLKEEVGANSAKGVSVARRSKTARQYTTQVILPSLTWVKSGVSASELQPGQTRAVQLVGSDLSGLKS